MKIFLIRHGKSDKSLQDKLPHDQFELQRGLVEGEAEKAQQLGTLLKNQIQNLHGYDLVHSGKTRSKQTVSAVAAGLGLTTEEAKQQLREDFGLSYLADKHYWEECEKAVKDGMYGSHADFFSDNPPEEFFQKKSLTNPGQTFSADYMKHNMRSVLRRAIERNIFLSNEMVVMVSHEPVLSLCMSDLTEKSVSDLRGPFNELEYATFDINSDNNLDPKVALTYREKNYEVAAKLFAI